MDLAVGTPSSLSERLEPDCPLVRFSAVSWGRNERPHPAPVRRKTITSIPVVCPYFQTDHVGSSELEIQQLVAIV